ncbi:ParB/RepB/Spo0J family partition protein [Hymenobacter sp. H14-R3]|uniref:ParB/RepB/Spo0J family partition protein n=1 Tax=Hymenobacter sp. H14-R3 TaxID=3046308 RepID=UPI0024B8BC3A|nr:ParB/RepB/Spo0J family partition protein [Hymenobacter sp. H14-R3]MDJ0367409.1 ParB/RepB/Spo0J family partition protein [Hymenobacter sp. H14-R3]
MAKAKKVLAAVGEPDVMPAPAPAPIVPEADLPWLDCNGHTLLEGDKAHVLPDISKRLSGKLVTIVGNYDAQSRSIEVEVHEDEPNLNNRRILPCYLRLLAVLGDNVGAPSKAPAPVAKSADEVAISMDAWDLLEKIIILGEAPAANVSGDAEPLLAELIREKLIEYTDGAPLAYRATELGQQAAAPEPVAEAAPALVYTPTKMKLVLLADIVVTSNTRKVFDETALAELANSIKAQGVIAPITVRPHGTEVGKFELVAGERRYRASKLAEQATIPAVIRTLTDREFLEVQLLENLQRVDVRPADEATAFSKLLASHLSAEEIAQRVGKPVKFVLQRAKLVALIPFWMELLEGERLPLVAAHELARLPAHSQVVVKKWMESSQAWELKQSTPLSASSIHHAITQEVLRQLAGAAFDKADATLCPVAGPCTTCPKNSANSRGLFDEAGTDPTAGKCLDSGCFADKKQAFLERRKKEFSGTNVPQISSSYATPPAGALGYKFYDRAKEGDKGAVAALMVDGTDAGAINWVKLSKGAPDAQAVAQDNKAERAAAIRTNRIKKMTNELLADKLRETFTAELLDPTAGIGAAHALLDHWLKRSLTFGKTRTPNDMLSHLTGCYGWEEPTEAELVSTWSNKGDSPHYLYLNRQLAAMPDVLEKVALFFDLKIRDGLEQTEYTGTQATLVNALPISYQPAFNVAKQAENRVQVRYYSKGKKQEATA